MPRIAARGVDALVGISIEQPSQLFNVGHPFPITRAVAAPDAPDAVAGAAGAVTGTITYYQTYVAPDGETAASTGSTPVVVSSKHVTVTLTPSVDSTVYAQRVYRSEGAHTTPYLVGTVWDNTTTTFDDNLAVTSPVLNYFNNPPTLDQTGANGGFCFTWPESVEAEPEWAVIQVPELRGTAFQTRGAPGELRIPWNLKRAARGGMSVPTAASLFGKPVTITRHADGMNTYVFKAVPAASAVPTSLSLLVWPGGSLRPVYLWNAMADSWDLDVKGGAVVDENVKGQAVHYSQCGIGEWKSTPAGTYASVPVVRGLRFDAAAQSEDVVIKVATAPTGGTFQIKASVGATPYGSTAHDVPYDTTALTQTKSAGVNVDWVELWDAGDVALGGDDDEIRRPFSVVFPGDVTDLALDDEFTIPYKARIPGPGSTPGTPDDNYTGFPARSVLQPRYTMSHASILRGEGAATESLEFQDAKISVAWALKIIEAAGKDGAVPVDFDRDGYCTAKVSFGRRFTDREFEWLVARDKRYVVQFKLEGARPLVQPGVRSNLRESITFDLGQLRVDGSPKRPISGPSLIMENVDQSAESPDNGTDPITVTIVTRQYWAFPASSYA